MNFNVLMVAKKLFTLKNENDDEYDEKFLKMKIKNFKKKINT